MTESAMIPWIVALVLLGFGLLLAATYNRLVKRRQLVREAWSVVDILLQQRHTLIPQLVAVVQEAASHENETLEALTAARTAAIHAGTSPAMIAPIEGLLETQLSAVMGLQESNPALRASEPFLALHEQLVNLEDTIERSRRYYNGTVENLNTPVEQFPSNIVARLFRVKTAPYFKATAIASP